MRAAHASGAPAAAAAAAPAAFQLRAFFLFLCPYFLLSFLLYLFPPPAALLSCSSSFSACRTHEGVVVEAELLEAAEVLLLVFPFTSAASVIQTFVFTLLAAGWADFFFPIL